MPTQLCIRADAHSIFRNILNDNLACIHNNSSGGITHDGSTSIVATDQSLVATDTNTRDDGYSMTTGR